MRASLPAEVAQLHIGLVAGSMPAHAMPAHTGHRARAAVLRAVGLRIDCGTVIARPLRVAGTQDPRRMDDTNGHPIDDAPDTAGVFGAVASEAVTS